MNDVFTINRYEGAISYLATMIGNPSVDRSWWRLNKADTHSKAELNIKPADERSCGVNQRSKVSVREGTKPSHKQKPFR